LGSYVITKTPGDENCTDERYDVIVEFTLGGTAQASNWGTTDQQDYQLLSGGDYNNGGAYISTWTTNGVVRGEAIIPAGQSSVTISLIAMTDSIFEQDETVTLTITKAYANVSDVNSNNSKYHFPIDSTGGTVTIYQAPEFLSDADSTSQSSPLPINGDSYKSYINHKATAGTEITTLTQIDAQKNHSVKYMIVSGNAEGLFEIDESAGIITAVADLKNLNLAASYPLTIRVFDEVHTQLYDQAVVTITISEWKVERDNGARASAVAYGGVTVGELADEIGLERGEFRQWLTYTTSSITLFNGTTKTPTNLLQSDILWGVQNFEIPNTIYMAWFGEMGNIGQWWMSFGQNQAELSNLGFNVVVFNNDSYYNYATDAAKWDFARGIEILAESKSIHGLYMMGHGSPTSIGSKGSHGFTSGPLWSIDYGKISSNTSLNGIESTWTIGTALNYKLGALVIHACHGNDSTAQADLLSSNGGIYHGFSGTYTPAPFFDDHSSIGDLWGEELIGQHTEIAATTLLSFLDSLVGGLLPDTEVLVQEYLIGGLQKTKTYNAVAYVFNSTTYIHILQ
jgi:hypothetical protein